MKQIKRSITLRLPSAMMDQVEKELPQLDLANSSQFIRHAIQEKLDGSALAKLIKDREVAHEEKISNQQVAHEKLIREVLEKVVVSERALRATQNDLQELMKSNEKNIQLLLNIIRNN